MADRTHIEWTDATWNIVTGCSVVSPGCTNCYAMRLAGTRLKDHPSRAGLTIDSKAGPVWNGQVRFNAEWLDQPLRWRKPRRIFVAAHGDLFHEGVTDDQLDQIFAVMALCPQHTFQVLTKRPARMRAYLDDFNAFGRISAVIVALDAERGIQSYDVSWPLRNVWLGVSVEDQARADERIPLLLDTPAAVRWISAEPLLGPLDLYNGDPDPRLGGHEASKTFIGDWWEPGDVGPSRHGLDWVVVGGESGAGSRPLHPDWIRSLAGQCLVADVPFLFKQWGDWEPRAEWQPGIDAPPMVAIKVDGSRVPDDVAPQDVGGHRMARVGKKAAGRLLDGVLHDEFPEAR